MTYEPSNYWKSLSKKANEFLDQYGYENFKCSVGIIYNDYYFDYTTGKLVDDYSDKVSDVWDSMYKNYPEWFLGQFSEPLEGSPLHIIFKGRPVTLDLAASICEYALLLDKIDFCSVGTINEIGGGYGRLAHVITQANPNIVYKMFDIEPSLSLAKRYLTSISPKSNITFYSPDKLDGKADILIAMDCLHEMNVEQVNAYFDYADKNCRYFYYTCWKDTHIQEDDVTWKQDSYPVRSNWKPLYLGQHRMRKDFFEALYQCQE